MPFSGAPAALLRRHFQAHQWLRFRCHFRCSSDPIPGAVQLPFLGLQPAPIFRRVEVPFFWGYNQRRSSAVRRGWKSPVRPCSLVMLVAGGHSWGSSCLWCRRLHGLNCIRPGCNPRGWRRERRCRCWSSPLGGRKIGSWVWVAGDIKIVRNLERDGAPLRLWAFI